MKHRLIARLIAVKNHSEVGINSEQIFDSVPSDEEMRDFIALAQEWFTEALGERELDPDDYYIVFEKQHEELPN